MRIAFLAAVVLLGQVPGPPPKELPGFATKQLADSLEASRAHARHVWRDTRPFNFFERCRAKGATPCRLSAD